MIPRTIHYCWFGDKEKPAEVLRMIANWQKHCPGYEIKEWNENNFDIRLIHQHRRYMVYICYKWADHAHFCERCGTFVGIGTRRRCLYGHGCRIGTSLG